MLVPFQTLFGWPVARNPSPLEQLVLLVGLPLLVMVIAFAVAKVSTMMRVSRTGGGVQVTDPIWMGGQSKSIMGGADYEGIGAEQQRAQIESGSGEGAESGTGGAGARW